ncbi:MAG: magnesium transporter CorA family protein [Planctomycetota bacterium]
MFRARAYLKDGSVEMDLSVEQVREIIQDSKNEVWIDIEDINPDDVAFLRDDLKIHQIAVEEVLSPLERPEIQTFENHILLVLHAPSPSLEKGGMDTIEIDFLVGNNFIVTVRSGPIASVKDMEDRVRANPRIMSRGCDFMLYFMSDAMVDDYLPILNALDKRIDTIQETAVKNPTRETSSDLMKLKADILEIRRATGPQFEVLRRLTGGYTDIIEPGLAVYFRSVCEHLQQVNSQLDMFREEVNSTVQVCLAIKSDQLNEVMKVLAIIAVIMMPLTLITGVFGMNFYFPDWVQKSALAWWLTGGVMAALGLGLFAYFKRKKWL